MSECEFWKTLKFEKSEETYANINETKEAQTNKVDSLKISKKYFILIFRKKLGIKSINEKIVEKHSEENPIKEIICNFFSIDYFFLTLF